MQQLLAPDAANSVGTQFVQHYYQTFAANRELLAPLYGAESWLTYEDAQVKGQADIINKLKSLGFQKVQHAPQKVDIHPSPGAGVLVHVTGDLSINDGSPMKFSQVFNLQPQASGGYFIANDMFRLNIG